MFGPFDKYFDFDHDGELSGFEIRLPQSHWL